MRNFSADFPYTIIKINAVGLNYWEVDKEDDKMVAF